MQINNDQLQQAVELLRDADGEDVQTVLRALLMEQQLCRQLIMTRPWTEVCELTMERMNLEFEETN